MNNPCDICVTKHKPQFGEGYCLYQNGGVMGDTCPKRDKYLGYQEGLAEGKVQGRLFEGTRTEARIHKREQEIVEFIKDVDEMLYQPFAQKYGPRLADIAWEKELEVVLESWLGKE